MGQIRVAKSYIDKESVSDLESAGYNVKLSSRGYWIVSNDEESADEITDSLRENGFSKIDNNLVKLRENGFSKIDNNLVKGGEGIKESNFERTLTILTEK